MYRDVGTAVRIYQKPKAWDRCGRQDRTYRDYISNPCAVLSNLAAYAKELASIVRDFPQ